MKNKHKEVELEQMDWENAKETAKRLLREYMISAKINKKIYDFCCEELKNYPRNHKNSITG